MVESKLSFFEMQIEGTLGQAIELVHVPLCLAPETFNTVDEAFARGEPISPVLDSETLVEIDINLTVVTWPVVGTSDRSWIDVTPNHSLQRGLGAVVFNSNDRYL